MLAVAVAGGAVAAAIAAQSPKALRTAIFAAARKQHAVHYVEIGAAQGLRQTIVGDVAATRGRQTFTFTLQGRVGQFTVLVVKRVAYLRGNALALAGYLGFTRAQASRYQGRWILVPHSNRRYKDLAAAVTLPSFLAESYPVRPLSLATAKIGGRKITGVRGTHREAGLRYVQTVYPRSKPPLLPLEVTDIEAKKGFVDATKISRWNETVRVGAPAHAVPIATVQAG